MKKIFVIGLIVCGVVSAFVILGMSNQPIYIENVQEVATSTVEVEVNNISEAQKQLNEAKRLLAEEEDKILAEIAERETRLEEIRAVRLSFTEAPAQQD